MKARALIYWTAWSLALVLVGVVGWFDGTPFMLLTVATVAAGYLTVYALGAWADRGAGERR